MSDADIRQPVSPAEPTGRPRIVWAYGAVSLLAVAYGIAFDIARGSVSPFGVFCDAAITAIAIAVIWNASRAGWVILTALGVLFLPFVLAFLDRGMWGRGTVAISVASLAILISPWMIRWIWRTRQPASDDANRP